MGGNEMNDRERREFEAGLSAEIDAWLAGKPTRRDFITKAGQAMGVLALSGSSLASMTEWALAQAKADLADESTPLG
jgi:multiple sugar transport system substrate-binding protein